MLIGRRSFTLVAAAAASTRFCPRLVAVEGARWRIGVIGHTGRGNYGHGLDVMWRSVPGCEVAAVADADPDGLAEATRRLGGVPGYSDYREMLTRVKPDIVAIAPRHIDQHLPMVLAAAEIPEVRGIYIEKPYCRSPREADLIRAACARRPTALKLAVAHRNRYHPVLPVIRRLLKEGAIGRPLEMRSRGKEDARSGALDAWVLGTHVFDLAAWIAGPPRACSAILYQDGRPCGREDIRDGGEGVGPIAGHAVHARFEMGDGTPYFFDSVPSSGVDPGAFGLQVIGTSGVLDFRVDRDPLAHIRRGNPHDPRQEPQPWIPISTAGIGEPEPVRGLAESVATHQTAALDLIDSIGNDRAPLCDEQAGATTVEMVCALFESHRLGGARVPFPLTTRDNPLAVMAR